MARKEKISEERRKLIQEFIKSTDLKTAGDVQEGIKDLFKDTIQEMLNAELTEHLGYEKNEYTDNKKITEMDIAKIQYIQQKEILQ